MAQPTDSESVLCKPVGKEAAQPQPEGGFSCTCLAAPKVGQPKVTRFKDAEG